MTTSLLTDLSGTDAARHIGTGGALIDKLAQLRSELLTCMHGSAWSGDGAAHLRKLDQSLAATSA
jgi:hypothetical protein